MEIISFIDHKGKKILYLDFSGLEPNEVLQAISDAKSIIKSCPPGSVLTLTNVTDTHFNETTAGAMKDFAKHNKSYVHAAAVVGITGLKKIIFDAVVRFSGRDITSFETVENAKDWLVSK